MEWMENVISHIVPHHMKKHFEEAREADFSYLDSRCRAFPHECFPAARRNGHRHALRQSAGAGLLSIWVCPLILRELAESPRGIVLLAGTTGSGKSTSLAAMIEHINGNLRKHIVTLEDPIEYVFEDNQSIIEQREVGLDTESFYNGLACRSAPGPGRGDDW